VNLQFFTWLEVQSLCQSAPVGGQHGRGGKENPHRHGAHRYKPIGVPFGRMVLGEHWLTPLIHYCKPDAKKKKAPTDQ